MLTTTDLALSYLHFLLATPHWVATRSVCLRDLPAEPQSWPRSPIPPTASQLGLCSVRREGQHEPDGSHRVDTFKEFLLSLCPPTLGYGQPSRPPHFEGWQASEKSSSSQKGQQALSLLICWF